MKPISERRQMMTRSKKMLSALGRTLNRLKGDRQGLGAVEFAIIFPILLSLYITAFELTIGFSVYKRATRAAGAIADLVSQPQTVNKAYLATMTDVASAVFAPYQTTGMTLKISGIQIDANKVARIAWSWEQSGKPAYNEGTIVSIPNNFKQANGFIIHSELTIPHSLLMFMSSLSSTITPITISRDYYFAKREADPITCGDC
ncbi:TadE/TadG family type IV pilus assembly protein [Rhizobium sp. Leaf311]|uniref:TadE/TadG family type IV pilus assembly protein n=1 Tax=Rhizobium sp. Leaf311 TaxID=1736332 RepID=UPI001FCD42C9|nr:TadE/TadG family type IV pilus assembly protein [Rhizobium sp. Leaf311]